MELQQRILRQLNLVRGIHESLQQAFHTPAEWVFQVHPTANHALWVAGHIGTVDNFLLSIVAPDHMLVRPGYQEKFGMGSRPTSRPEDYPPPEEVCDYMRQTRASLLAILVSMDDARLRQPPGPNAPEFVTDVAAAFETAVWHESLHVGQMTVSRRALGHPSMVDTPPQK